MSAKIEKISDEDISVVLRNTVLGEIYAFDAMVDTDTTFMIPHFEYDGGHYIGSGNFADKLRIALNDGCTIFNVMVATTVFKED